MILEGVGGTRGRGCGSSLSLQVFACDLARLLGLVFAGPGVLDGQAPDVEVVADGGDDVVLGSYQRSFPRESSSSGI